MYIKIHVYRCGIAGVGVSGKTAIAMRRTIARLRRFFCEHEWVYLDVRGVITIDNIPYDTGRSHWKRYCPLCKSEEISDKRKGPYFLLKINEWHPVYWYEYKRHMTDWQKMPTLWQREG